jgi:Tfp pilus assembly PilM family ATPase
MAPWVEKCGLQRFPCVLGFAGSQSVFQPLTLAADDPRTNEQACSIEVVKFNEMASEQMTYGFAPISVRKDQRSLLLAMARLSLVDAFLGIARESGLNVIELMPGPVALFNAFEALVEQHEAPYLYLNIGASATEMAIGSSAGLLFARAFAAGGQVFTDAVAKARKLSTGQAEDLKVSSSSVKAENSLADAFAPAAALWLQELNACLAVYRSLYADPKLKPVKAILCGGSAALRGLPEFVSASLNVETVLADAMPGVPIKDKPAHFMAATGLALAGLGLGQANVSLLPPMVRDELSFKRQKPFWIAAGILAVAILAVSLLGGYRDFVRMEGHLKGKKLSLTRRQQLAGQIEQVTNQCNVVSRMAVPVKEMLTSGPVVRDLITLIANAKDPEDWVSLLADENYYFEPPSASDNPLRLMPTDPRKPRVSGTNNIAIQRVIVEGYYTRRSGLHTVKDLIAKLTNAASVASADSLGDDLRMPPPPGQTNPISPGVQPFAIDITVKR